MNNEFKIITLGDIFKNIETEEKAFKFKDYIKKLQEENERLNNIINELDKQNRQLGEKLSLTTDKYEKKLFIKENIIKEVREYIESIEKVDCRYFDYNRALKEMLISYEDLKKKVEEDGTLEGHFIEINKLKLLDILDKEKENE